MVLLPCTYIATAKLQVFPVMTNRRPLTPDEAEDARRLKAIYNQAKQQYRDSGKKLTHETLAHALGWSGQAAVSQYLNANIPLNFAAAVKFARFFNVPLKDISPRLSQMLPSAAKIGDSNTKNEVTNNGTVPLLSWVQAGAWQEIGTNGHAEEAEGWVLCSTPHSSSTFALVVRGESMYSPGDRLSFSDGDIIHVDPEVRPENNALVVVRCNTHTEATFKQLIIEGDQYYLKALNPSWPDRIKSMPEDAVIAGVVISKHVSFR